MVVDVYATKSDDAEVEHYTRSVGIPRDEAHPRHLAALYTLLHPYSTLLYTLPLLHSTLYSAPTPLYPTLPLQHSSLLTQPQLHPTLLHPSTRTHYDTHLTAVRCFHPALLHCYTAALSLCTLCPSCPPARYRPAGQ